MHETTDAQTWRAARVELLRKEKEFTRLRDDLAQQRRDLPWERVDKTSDFHDSQFAAVPPPAMTGMFASALPAPVLNLPERERTEGTWMSHSISRRGRAVGCASRHRVRSDATNAVRPE